MKEPRNKPGRAIWLLLLMVLGAAISSPQPSLQGRAGKQSDSVVRLAAAMPLYLEANHGQAAPQVRYITMAGDSTLFLTSEAAVLTLNPSRDGTSRLAVDRKGAVAKSNADARLTALVMKLAGAHFAPDISGEGELPGKSNYFVGNDPHRWLTDIPHYARVRYRNIYPGVDAVFYPNQSNFEYDFIMAPGADPSQIRLEFSGIDRKEIDRHGNLVLRAGPIELRHRSPSIYQIAGGVRRPVQGGFAFRGENPVQVVFRVGAYDKTLPLIIDPVMEYSRFFGGSKEDEILSLAVDKDGNAYLSGETSSPDLQLTSGALPHQPTAFQTEGNTLAFVAKVDATGQKLIYCTYLGGSKTAVGHNIKIDAAGNAYIGGRTEANDFPVKNPIQATFGGGSDDGFLTKLNSSGSALVYSTYLGGSEYDQGRALAVDGAGNAYLTGITESPNFPTKNPVQAKFGGQQDSFVLKVNAAGTALVYSTYLGGAGNDVGHAITVDSAGNAYITGLSNSADFPTAKPFQASYKGGAGNDVIVVKINAAGTALAYATYLGGSKNEESRAIAVDAAGNATITGYTQSTDFPTAKPLQARFAGGSNDLFVTQFSAAGETLNFSTYLGGGGADYGRGLALDAARNIYLTGYTDSKDFPTKDPFQAAYAGGSADTIAVKLNPSGSALLFSSYLGGSAYERGRGIAVDARGGVYISGRTESKDFPVTKSLTSKFGGGPNDAYLVKISDR